MSEDSFDAWFLDYNDKCTNLHRIMAWLVAYHML